MSDEPVIRVGDWVRSARVGSAPEFNGVVIAYSGMNYEIMDAQKNRWIRVREEIVEVFPDKR